MKEHLHLLSLPISPTTSYAVSASLDLSIGNARRGHERQIIVLDNSVFDDFWRFNSAALADALRATPSSYYRVALRDKAVIGYAITGLASNRGYLQRLAVSSQHQGQNIGRSLIFDALAWLQRRGARRVFVNTQECNTRAFALYQHLGFQTESEGLMVLSRDVPS